MRSGLLSIACGVMRTQSNFRLDDFSNDTKGHKTGVRPCRWALGSNFGNFAGIGRVVRYTGCDDDHGRANAVLVCPRPLLRPGRSGMIDWRQAQTIGSRRSNLRALRRAPQQRLRRLQSLVSAKLAPYRQNRLMRAWQLLSAHSASLREPETLS